MQSLSCVLLLSLAFALLSLSCVLLPALAATPSGDDAPVPKSSIARAEIMVRHKKENKQASMQGTTDNNERKEANPTARLQR